MSLLEFRFMSGVLVKQTAATVIYPDSGVGPFPVFYLLHGSSDDHTNWQRSSRIESYVSGLPLIVVMPDGYRGYYTNMHEGYDYAKHLAEELPAKIEANFHAKTTGKASAIGGLSMGGYGALRLGLGNLGRYASINSHSGALLADQRLRSGGIPGEMDRIFGPYKKGSSHDLLALAKKARQLGRLPPIRIDCGTEDFLLNENRSFHASLNKLGVKHEYEEFPGAHTWDYWDLHVRDAIAFHCKALGIKK
ncbi:hypothetical protein BH10PLA1_BH10PLA1_20000 [soil metagenome]